MDGSPQLLTNIQFAEAKKGYDRDQVDNFLKELSTKIGELQDLLRQAAQRAEAAEARIVEAEKAKAVAEAVAQKAKADLDKASAEPAPAPAPVAAVNEVEAAAGMLALAQKTADAAIADADAKGKEIVADARAKAAMIIVEVEQDVDKIKAQVLADSEQEVACLKSERDGIRGELASIERLLDDHRSRLRATVAALTQVLDNAVDPEVEPPGGGGGPGAPKAATAVEDDSANDADGTDAGEAEEIGDEPAPIPFVPEGHAEPIPLMAEPDRVGTEPSGLSEPSEPSPAVPVPIMSLVPDHVSPDPDSGESPAMAVDEGADPRRSTAELTIVTLEDIEGASVADDPGDSHSTVAADEAPVRDESKRAVQVADLLEAPTPSSFSPAAATPSTPPDAGDDVVTATPVIIAATGTDGPPRARSMAATMASPAPTLASAPADPLLDLDLTADALFGRTGDDGGEPTQAFDVLSDDSVGLDLHRDDSLPAGMGESPLGRPDAGADEAMREFFERDLDKLDKAPKGRFLRRK